MRDYRKGKRCMVWSFLGNTRMYQALNQYGDRLDTVGIFTFEVDATGTIRETGTSVSDILPYIKKWPHIKWMLTVMNHGVDSIFTALRNNTGGAKTKFLSELVRIIQKYTWCAGVDIDLERGGGYENREAAKALFRDIYTTVKGHSDAKLVNICLPGMTGVQGSVGGENWCVYADLNPYCDTAAIMSYGMAWAGSAPGPVSPKSWLDGIYNYAVKVMTPSKIFLGMPTYGWEWQIFDTPVNQGKTYRGTSLTYYAAEIWMNGGYHYEDHQQYIPFFAYWDDYDKVPWLLPFVYDFMEGHDCTATSGPITKETYNRRRYLICYGKEQSTSFGTVYVDRNGNAASDKQAEHVHYQVDEWNGSRWVPMDPTPFCGIQNIVGQWTNSGRTPAPAPAPGEIGVGTMVEIQPGSTRYYPGSKTIPGWVISDYYHIVTQTTVDGNAVQKGKKTCVLLGKRKKKSGDSEEAGINTWVNIDILTVAGRSGATEMPTYTVKKGDSLWAIAAAQFGNGARYEEIQALNGLPSELIHPGQVLKLPTK